MTSNTSINGANLTPEVSNPLALRRQNLIRMLASKRFLLVVIAMSATFCLLRFNAIQVGMFQDDAHYIILAESVASGQGFRLINYPQAPPEPAFPPGWPLLLAPFTILFPDNVTILKGISLLFWLATIPLLYSLLAPHLRIPYREIVVALVAVNPLTIGSAATVMSEPAYLFFSIATLKLFDLWEQRRGQSTYWLLAGAVVALALYTQLIRTVGISLVLAIVTYLVLARRHRVLVVAAAVIAAGMLPVLWLNWQRGGLLASPTYQSVVLDWSSPLTKAAQMADNLQRYVFDGVLANTIVPIFGPQLTTLAGQVFGVAGAGAVLALVNLAIATAILFGFVVSLRSLHVLHLYAGYYFLAVLAFWYIDGLGVKPRLLIPLLPFLYLYLFSGVAWIGDRLNKGARAYHAAVTVATLLLVLILVGRNVEEWRYPLRNRTTNIAGGAAWLVRNTHPEAVILARNPEPLYLYVRRRTVGYPEAYWQEKEIRNYIDRTQIDYILISRLLAIPQPDSLDRFTQEALLPFIAAHPDTIQLVHTEAEDVAVYRVDRSGLVTGQPR